MAKMLVNCILTAEESDAFIEDGMERYGSEIGLSVDAGANPSEESEGVFRVRLALYIVFLILKISRPF